MKYDRLRAEKLHQAELLILRSKNMKALLGNWLADQLEKAKRKQSGHIIVGYLASPYGQSFAEKTERLLEPFLLHAASECPRLRKKFIEAKHQPEFEALFFELEVGCRLLSRRYQLVVEPFRKERGPDFRIGLGNQSVYVEVKKLQPDADEQKLRESKRAWARIITPAELDKRMWNLHERYLVGTQFPRDGLHVLVVDIFKSLRSDSPLSRAWEYYCSQPQENPRDFIHALVVCRRERQRHAFWLNDLTDGVSISFHPVVSTSNTALETLKSIFGEDVEPE
jgi:hypothetical protein